jgi:hypothetical protein
MKRRGLGLCLALAGLSGPAQGQAVHSESLGTVHFPVSCNAAAQPQFTRAVALLHHMTYPEARKAFGEVAATDPQCAMAHWGIAMTLFQPLWPTRPNPQALQLGWDEVGKAEALPLTDRERLFVNQAKAFFLDPASTDYWTRIRRWEQAAEQGYHALPDDPEIAAFYALAHLATTPATTVTRAYADSAAGILERLYRKNPDHPGAMHYLVHANDIPGREGQLLDITRKYDASAPHNPHALHMPTHIYVRLGEWDGVIRGNRKAAQAAREQPAGEHGEYVWDEFPHAMEYLVYGYLQQGADREALALLRQLEGTPALEPSFKTAFHLSSTRARYALERRDWKAAAAIVPREPAGLAWDRFPWAEAVSRFARGLGLAHLKRLDEAGSEAARLAALEDLTRKSGEELFARNIRVLRLELDGWLAQRRGQSDSARGLLEEAVALEASTPKHAVTPAPTLPALELLGNLLVEQEHAADAVDAYRRSLAAYPNRRQSLLGLTRALKALPKP